MHGHRRTKTANPFSRSKKAKSKKRKISKVPLIRDSYVNSAPSPNRGRRNVPNGHRDRMRESEHTLRGVTGYHIVDSDGGSISYIDFNEDEL